MTSSSRVRLTLDSGRDFDPGRGLVRRAVWFLVETVVFRNPLLTSYSFKRSLLRFFGASIGENVVIKTSVHVKFPWRLTIGDNSWIGERAWIDNLAEVRVGANVCVSQGAYLCTGNHDWSRPDMPLVAEPITIEDGSWIGAFARIAPGTTVGAETVVALGAVLLTSADPHAVYRGNPAVRVGPRRILESGRN